MRRPPTRRRAAAERGPPRRRSLPGVLVIAMLFAAALAALSYPRVAVGVAVGATVVAAAVRRGATVPIRPSERAPAPARRAAPDRGSRSH